MKIVGILELPVQPTGEFPSHRGLAGAAHAADNEDYEVFHGP
jgi:hypothetical protein